MQIGFIGTGVMGASICKHLLNAGHTLHIFTRTKEKAAELIELGASWYGSPAEVAHQAEVVFTMVGYPQDVDQVYTGDQGLFESTSAKTFIDLTTSTPELARNLAEQGQKLGFQVIDAPVSGGDIGAQQGVLSIMIGGDEKTVESLQSLFTLFGKNIVYHGAPGAGQHTKMCNQIAIASTMIAVCESLTYGKKAGLDLNKVLESITQGAAGSWSLSNLGPKMIAEDYQPGFYIKHFVKDMGIALSEAERMGIKLPGLTRVKSLYDDLITEGFEDEGTQALIRHYKKQW
ncbi:NAD(P)-dependent oxidoreductase [Chryseomicrobium sp. FSL W7-1435]|uniref:NAD(P)-dependent oxidoreductase n=1 Tax=Chryseomicrobium sp. FSL W7-1435 TaxID=2921704 RepID=UPI00315997F4